MIAKIKDVLDAGLPTDPAALSLLFGGNFSPQVIPDSQIYFVMFDFAYLECALNFGTKDHPDCAGALGLFYDDFSVSDRQVIHVEMLVEGCGKFPDELLTSITVGQRTFPGILYPKFGVLRPRNRSATVWYSSFYEVAVAAFASRERAESFIALNDIKALSSAEAEQHMNVDLSNDCAFDRVILGLVH